MRILFLITFVNLLGFGLIIPLLPFYIERVGGGPEIITLVIALYSLLQFLTAPTIGRLSDRYGRRPVLIWTTVGVIVSHLLLGFADSLWLVILARSVGGIAAGNAPRLRGSGAVGIAAIAGILAELGLKSRK